AADDAVDAASGDAAAAKIEKERLTPAGLACRWGWVSRRALGDWRASSDVLEHRANFLGRRTVERHEPLFAAFAPRAHDPTRQVDALQIEIDELAQPQS